MDNLGINIMFLMPSPQTVGQDIKNNLDDFINIADKNPDRFIMGSDEFFFPQTPGSIPPGEVWKK